MKYFYSVLLILGLLACNPKSLPTVFVQKDNYALLKISHETTKNELQQIKDQLENQKIMMDYSGSSFFDNDRIQILRLQIITPAGHTGQTNADIVNLQYRYYGFKYDKTGSPVFKIGEMPEN
jgi:hypothetical protein